MVVDEVAADESTTDEVAADESTTDEGVDSTTADADDDGEVNAEDASPYGEGSHAVIDDDPEQMPDGFPIKGNDDSKLYHTPDSPFYERTKAEVWFASEEAAEAAGFSKPASQTDDDETDAGDDA